MSDPGSRFWPIAMVVILCGPLALVAALLVWHATYVAFFAPWETVMFYQFGSEDMGWRHQSRMVYFLSGVAEAMLMLVASGLLAWWLLRRPSVNRQSAESSSEGDAE